MNDVILIMLANRWEKEAETPEIIDGSEKAREANAKAQGYRECKRECADALQMLVSLLGESKQ